MNKAILTFVRYKYPTLRKILTRKRLINALTARKERKLILVHAKPGQGKSSLIADFIRIGKLTAVWYNLSEDDSDPILLLQRIQEPLSIIRQRQATCKI